MGILIKPLLTEKSEILREKKGYIGFVVKREANKVEIKKEIEKEYNVEVLKVNTFIKHQKTMVRNTRSGASKGRKPVYKRAFVKLKEGQTLDLFSKV